MFKLQQPQDLVSRLFILEYIRELGVETIKDKLTAGEAKFWLYSFKGEEGDTTEYALLRSNMAKNTRGIMPYT